MLYLKVPLPDCLRTEAGTSIVSSLAGPNLRQARRRKGVAVLGGVTSTSFGLAIAYLLPGIVAFYGASLWSGTIARVFSTFLTAEANGPLFLMVFLVGLVLGIAAQAIAWLAVESAALRILYTKERTLLSLRFRGRVLFAGFKSGPLQRISGDDYARLREPDRLSAYRAFIDEIYRYYQFWSGLVVVLPIVLIGWGWKAADDWSVLMLIFYALVAIVAEAIAFAKCADSWVGTQGAGLAILKEALHGGEEEHREAEVNR